MQAVPQILKHGIPADYRIWLVFGPETQMYPQTEVEPAEYGHDVLYVAALTAAHAIKSAIPMFRAVGATYLEDNENPYHGVVAEDMTCRHGMIPYHLIDGEEPYDEDWETNCPACVYEIERELHAIHLANAAGFWEY